MSKARTVLLPDIGDFTDVEIIELHVAVGDRISLDDPVLTLESDKATMDIPSTVSGVVKNIAVKIGDKVSEGDLLVAVEETKEEALETSENADSTETVVDEIPETAGKPSVGNLVEVQLPNIGDFSDVEIIDLHVHVDDVIAVDDPIITLESEKSTMDIPTTTAGVVASIMVQVGDKVSEGDTLISVEEIVETTKSILSGDEDTRPAKEAESLVQLAPESKPARQPQHPEQFSSQPPASLPPPVERAKGILPHASPSVRQFARELGADLSKIRGSGPKGRITREDVQSFVKLTMESGAAPNVETMPGVPPIPAVDFSNFGDTERVDLSKIKRITGNRLHRSWLDIPHVTHHDETDVTELESFRKEANEKADKDSPKITMLSFICKAAAYALAEFPTFNSSLSSDSEALILKKYINIGIAVDTPNGLVVPVIKNIRSLGINEIAKVFEETSERARAGKLTPTDFEGGCFTISSLGGIGGRFFTPIINPPEVAILGVSRHHQVLVPNSSKIDFRLMLPLSLSYDHRVIDGAEAARFVAYISSLLQQPLQILL